MFEYHGWITIREKPYFVEDGDINYIVMEIKKYIENLKWNSGEFDVHPVNGEYHILVTGFSNHAYIESCLLDFFNFVAKVSAGSYGLLYMRNDEDVNGNDNMFRVVVLSRGRISKHTDPFLSLFIPLVEDESNPMVASTEHKDIL